MGNCLFENKKWIGIIYKEKQYYYNKSFLECDYKKGIVAWNNKKIS